MPRIIPLAARNVRTLRPTSCSRSVHDDDIDEIIFAGCVKVIRELAIVRPDHRSLSQVLEFSDITGADGTQSMHPLLSQILAQSPYPWACGPPAKCRTKLHVSPLGALARGSVFSSNLSVEHSRGDPEDYFLLARRQRIEALPE